MDEVMSPLEIKEKKPYLEWGLSEKEYDYICEKLLKRLPNYTETGLLAVMWSEHCSYKMSKPLLKLLPKKNSKVLQGPGEGAGIIDIGDDQAVVFKAESHNHPSAVEPYEGAATGVGGILRDIFSMGARPIASLDSLHFNEIKSAHDRYLIDQVVAGIGGYGNCIGVPTIGGETTFDSCYKGNPLVNAMSIGIMNVKDIQQGRAEGDESSIIYVGAKTGRDGIHGATFASADFSDEHETQRSAVQVGDPFMEKLLMEACLKLIQEHPDWLIGIQDMGAAGLVSSSCEMASKSHTGVKLNLDLVPQRETNMTAYEIMLSESQERMLLCVPKEHTQDVIDLFKEFNLEAAKIGEVIDDTRYVLTHEGKVVTDIPVSTLTDDVLQEIGKESIPERISTAKEAELPKITNAKEIFYKLLKQPTIASKKSLTTTYDSQVRASTVAGPNGINDAGIIKVRGKKKGIAATTDGNGRFVYLDPKIGSEIAVLEAAMNLLSVGADPLAITDCLNFGDPHDPEVYWELHQSIIGMAEACRHLDTPVVSGNVSLYNESNGEAIYPTPMVGMVGLIKDVNHYIRNSVSYEDENLYLIGKTEDDFSGSEIQKMQQSKINGKLRELDWNAELTKIALLKNAIDKNLISSAHDISEGGIAVALSEMFFNTRLGVSVDLAMPVRKIFSETPGRMIVGVADANKKKFESILMDNAQFIGKVNQSAKIQINCTDDKFIYPVYEAQKIWEDAIPCLMKKKD